MTEIVNQKEEVVIKKEGMSTTDDVLIINTPVEVEIETAKDWNPRINKKKTPRL